MVIAGRETVSLSQVVIMTEHILERTVTLASKSGLHARPAAVFVKKAKAFRSTIKLYKNDKEVDGKSILGVLTLGAEQGEQVTLKVNGEDANTAIDQLTALLEEDLG
jgi:phosphocarrier protein HPr